MNDNYNPLDELDSEVERMFEFDNKDYLYINYDEKNNILYAGHATNTDIMREVEIEYDKEESLYTNLEKLYDACIDDDPERLK